MIRTSYDQNQNQSPFLQLPAELRNRIYEHVLSNKVIHVSVRDCPWNDSGAWSYKQYDHFDRLEKFALKLTHTTCSLAPDAEDKAYNSSCFPGSDPPADTLNSYLVRHRWCYAAVRSLKRNWTRDVDFVYQSSRYSTSPIVVNFGLELALLGTCRQIYQETALIPYLTNTFAFHEALTLDLFISKSLLEPQRSALRTLQLDGWAHWNIGTVNATTISMLTGLNTLQIWLMNGRQCDSGHAPGYECLYSFAKHLQPRSTSVKVIIGADNESTVRTHHGSQILYDRKRRREQARDVERKFDGVPGSCTTCAVYSS